jgi:hypothetical protein
MRGYINRIRAMSAEERLAVSEKAARKKGDKMGIVWEEK